MSRIIQNEFNGKSEKKGEFTKVYKENRRKLNLLFDR